MDETNSQQSVVNNLEKLSFVEVYLVFQQHIQVGLDVLHYKAHVEISVFVVWLEHVDEFRNHDVRSEESELEFAESFKYLYFSELLDDLVLRDDWVLHNLECHQLTADFVLSFENKPIASLADDAVNQVVFHDCMT